MEYTLKVNAAEMETIARGLGKLPGEQMFALLCKLLAYKDAQDKSAAAPQPTADNV